MNDRKRRNENILRLLVFRHMLHLQISQKKSIELQNFVLNLYRNSSYK